MRPVRFVPGGSYAFMENLIKEYLEWKGTYAPRASVNYKIWLNRFLDVCGIKQLSQYDVSDIIRYRKWLEFRFNSTTVQFAIIVIKNFLQYCKIKNLICLSPVLIRLPRVNPKSHRAVKEPEFQKIISSIPQSDFGSLRDLIIIRILWDTGIRISELCDLDLAQIEEKTRKAVIKTKKTGKPRIIVWSKETHNLLMKYMPIRKELFNINHASPLFVCRSKNKGWNSRLTARSIQRNIKQYVEKAGIKEKVTPHSFRHGWANKRRDNNAPLAFIQKGLGHNNPVSTFVYEQYNDLEFEKNANFYLQQKT